MRRPASILIASLLAATALPVETLAARASGSASPQAKIWRDPDGRGGPNHDRGGQKEDPNGRAEGGSDDPGVVTSHGSGTAVGPVSPGGRSRSGGHACAVAVLPEPSGRGARILVIRGGAVSAAALESHTPGLVTAEAALSLARQICGR